MGKMECATLPVQPVDATLSILNGKDGVCDDTSRIFSRLHCGREYGLSRRWLPRCTCPLFYTASYLVLLLLVESDSMRGQNENLSNSSTSDACRCDHRWR